MIVQIFLRISRTELTKQECFVQNTKVKYIVTFNVFSIIRMVKNDKKLRQPDRKEKKLTHDSELYVNILLFLCFLVPV